MSNAAEPFILSADPALLRALRDSFSAEDADCVISVSGPAAAPRRIVVMLPPDRAAALQRALGAAVVVASDDPLEREQPPVP
ncbi:hypothetical protein HQQ81_14325 [Microbacteriaceae bacterium VKM Ac-2854]|nr:hypothetical protein [Microbacteriaceae bacterium VKM Ac-2854]